MTLIEKYGYLQNPALYRTPSESIQPPQSLVQQFLQRSNPRSKSKK